MSKKRSIILISVIALITIIFVVTSTVFRVNFMSVSISEVSEKFTNSQIISASGIEQGKTIFFINKQKAIDNIESKIPYAKVNKIETKFPNKLIFHMEERKELAYFSISSTYYIVDEDLKVLRTASVKPSLIKLSGYGENTEAGKFLSITKLNSVFDCFGKIWQINNGAGFTLNNADAIDKISEIEYNSAEKTVNFITKEGFKILVNDGVNYHERIVMVIGMILQIDNAYVVNNRISGEYEIVTSIGGFAVSTIEE